MCLWRSEEGMGSLGIGAMDSVNYHVDVGNWTWVLFKLIPKRILDSLYSSLFQKMAAPLAQLFKPSWVRPWLLFSLPFHLDHHQVLTALRLKCTGANISFSWPFLATTSLQTVSHSTEPSQGFLCAHAAATSTSLQPLFTAATVIFQLWPKTPLQWFPKG